MSRRYTYRPPPTNHPLFLTHGGIGTMSSVAVLPSSADLRAKFLAPRDQGAEGCCSGFGTAALREALHCIAAGAFLPDYLSPAYLYARTRMIEGTFPADAGATVADEMTTLMNYGVCPESNLPYTGNASEAPTPVCDVAAEPFRITPPACLNVAGRVDLGLLKTTLGIMGRPAVFGMPVYQSFEATGLDGLVAVPAAGETLLGGHCMVAVGYDDATQRVIVRNSWGQSWGLGGYCFIPYAMVPSWYEGWSAEAIS